MNVWGHKQKAKQALKNERFWASQTHKLGFKAENKANWWFKLKKWHQKKIKQLKREKE